MFPVINLGPLSIPAPAFILIIGYIAGSYFLDKKSKSFSINPELIDRALWIGTVSALLGARLSYIAGSPESFKGNLQSVLSLNPALLDPVGGLVIGAAAIILIISREKTDYWMFLDSTTLFFGPMLPALYLSRFSSGSGYGLPTGLPWGIYLWGEIRHPVQLYLAAVALVLCAVILVYAPFKNLPSGSTFLLFSSATFSYLLFFTAFQEPTTFLLSLFRIEQIIFWLLLFTALLLLNYRFKSVSTKAHHETTE